MGVIIRQASFGAGEVAPAFYSRPVESGLRTCRNFLVTPEGTAANRPGTTLVGAVKDYADGLVRLVPFIFSSDQAYVLEFGDEYVRVWLNGEAVLDAFDVLIDVATTYQAFELSRLKFAQSGDTLIITHPSHPPRALVRASDGSWSIADWGVGSPAISAPQSAVGSIPASYDAADATHPIRTWQWVITAVDANGEESGPSNVVEDTTAVLYPDKKGIGISWSPPASGTPVYYRVFRGHDGIRGLIATADTNCGYKDRAVAPDFFDVPPTPTNPFGSSDNYPAVVAFFQQRLWFGSSNTKPATLWASRIAQYKDFGAKVFLKDDDAFNFRLAAVQFEEIRSLVPLRAMIALTGTAAWAISGGGDAVAITPTTIDGRRNRSVGASWLDPVVVGNDLVYVSDKGGVVRGLAFDANVDGYSGANLSLLARHLVRGTTVNAWAYAEEPFSTIWMARDDGSFLGLTYVRDQKILAWHRHDTGAEGHVESICTVPEGTEDAVYMVVHRTTPNGTENRYIERMASRLETDVRKGVFLDSALIFDGRVLSGAQCKITGATYAAGDTVTIVASLAIFTTLDVGSQVSLNPDADDLRILITAYTNGTHCTGELVTPAPVALQDAYADEWAFARTVFSAPHLSGATVGILADGYVVDQQVVQFDPVTATSNAIVLTDPAVDVIVGLPITADFATLDLPSERGRMKRVSRVIVEVEASRGAWVGEDLTVASMREWRQRTVSDGYGRPALATESFDVLPKSTWNLYGRVAIQQRDPLPLTILAVSREVDGGT